MHAREPTYPNARRAKDEEKVTSSRVNFPFGFDAGQ